MQDATKVLLGSHGSNDIVSTCEVGDPATFKAGLAVRKHTDGSLSLTSGQLIGVSLGKDLSNLGKTSVARAGNDVVLQLSEYLVKAQLTFISKRPGIPIAIELVAGGTAGSEVVTVTGSDDAGYLISVSMDNVATKSTTTQIKAALDAKAEALALIETQIASGQGSTEVDAFAEDDVDTMSAAVVGAAVRVGTGGAAIPSGGTLTGAIYVSGALYGVDPDSGDIVARVAKIDLAGGL